MCLELIKEALDDYQDVVLDYVVGSRRDFIENNVNVIDVISIGEAFNKMMQWVDDYYEGIKGDD